MRSDPELEGALRPGAAPAVDHLGEELGVGEVLDPRLREFRRAELANKASSGSNLT